MDICVIPFPPLPQPWQINATSVRKSSPGEGQQQLAQKKGFAAEIWMQNSAWPAQGRGKMFSGKGMSQRKQTQNVSCPRAKFVFLSWGKADPFSLGEIKKERPLSHGRPAKTFALSV